MTAAKIAALPCLRNLASFVSNQGRQVDAEMVLVREKTMRYFCVKHMTLEAPEAASKQKIDYDDEYRDLM